MGLSQKPERNQKRSTLDQKSMLISRQLANLFVQMDSSQIGSRFASSVKGSVLDIRYDL
jgi:hypothetical protein